MAPKHKSSSKAESSGGSPRKKVKSSKNGNDGQSELGSFVKSPKNKSNEGSAANGVISLLSDSEPGDEGNVEHVIVPSSSKSHRRPVDSEVIDLEDVLSSDSDNEDVKPVAGPSSLKNGSNASLHPLFRKSEVKTEDDGHGLNGARDGAAANHRGIREEDVKPRIDMKGKGKAEGTSDSPKKLIFPKVESDEPVTYPLEKDIFEFDPKNDISTETWPRTQAGKLHTPYSFLVAAFVIISATRSRLIIVTVMTNTLRTIVEYDPEALKDAVYLITNHVAPAYEGVELGIGSQVLGKALKAVSGAGPGVLRSLWHQYGDAGDVAFHAKAKVRTLFASQPLTIASLYNNLVTLTGLKGSGTVNKKADIVQRMLVAAKGEEVRFLVRTLVAHLRIGAVRLTVTASLARAFCLIPPSKLERDIENVDAFYITPEEREGVKAVAKTVKEGKDDPKRLELMSRLAKAESLVREVYVRHPNYDNIVPALLSVGLSGLSDAIPLQVGTPLSPMLGQITRDLGDVAGRLEPTREFAAEWKYDGQRVQIHCERRKKGEVPAGESKLSSKKGGGQWVSGDVYVRLFSRHLEDMTAKYPDILQLMPQLLLPIETDEQGNVTGVQSFIMDAEIVAIDPETKALLTFQTLANRARKDVSIHEVKVKVGIFAFDLMYLNGQTLINKPFRERRHLLKSRFPPREPSEPTIARFDHVKCMEGFPTNLEPIRQFMLEAISQKCEGLMLKLLDSSVPSSETAKLEQVDDELTAEEGDGSEEDQLEEAGEDEATEGVEFAVKKKGRRKALLATYEPGSSLPLDMPKGQQLNLSPTDKRVESWLKVKRDYGDLGDSLDVVPIGAWHGQGRKVNFWSPILLAVYDPDTETYQALCKCISGFTDVFYKQLNERYPEGSETCSSSLKIPAESGLTPTVWWEPSEVWEIRGADLTLSPVYTAAAGLVSAERGLSLRFPRFIQVRTDKSVEQATTPQDLADMYRRQSEGHKHPKAEEPAPATIDDAEKDFGGF